ncbi:transcriptional regulator, AraC family [Geodermatophilus saharensis]|uniref:Transcriptional regulator, AraC family n=1 Tax=Geodermatophilus saharensis TaxID=1137994 RepID=A0A239AHB7_9ACTN|nr:helix-turn-helix domain-containing protein [Geodermatophilus saharensis]SNR94762.1 transcriptional regulator, AraC family [Geodermatophilus saharensis]
MPTSTTTRCSGVRPWRDLLGEHFVDLDVAPATDRPVAGEVSSRALGSLQLSRVGSVDQRAVRTAGLARADGRRYVQVGLLERGAARVQQDGRECWLQPGDYALYETDRPFTWELSAGTAPAWSLLVVTWCRPEASAGALTARRLDGSAGLTGVLGRMMTDLVHSPDVTAADPGDRLAAELLDLVTTAAGAAPPRPAGTPRGEDALVCAVRAYVEEHLADPGLGPREIAAAHFVSVRQLHRLFAGRQETVAGHVRRRRLERAREELGRADARALPVSAVARRCGFPDPSVFGRAFRAAYGLTPSRYRALAAGG